MKDQKSDSGVVLSEDKTDKPLNLTGFHKVITPDGVVYFPVGINPDRIWNERINTEWPYSRVIACIICQKITEGTTMVAISKMEGFPPLRVINSWKARDEFKEMLRQAYRDKAEWAADRALFLSKNGFDSRLEVDTLKWSAQVDDPNKFSTRKKPKDGERPVRLQVKTKD